MAGATAPFAQTTALPPFLPALVSSKPSSFFSARSLPAFRGLAAPFGSRNRKQNVSYPRCICSLKNEPSNVLSSQVKIDDLDDEACELVSGVDLILGEGDNTIHAYLLKAVKNNNGAGVLLLSDIFGFEDSSTRDFAYRVACHGYNVLVPDLFRGNPWNKIQDQSKLQHWLEKQFDERIARDIATSAKWMNDEFIAAGMSKKLGIIGFCFGGGHLFKTLAHDEQTCFGTGICFYGTRIDTSLASKIKVPILFISGDNDPLCSISTLHDIEKNVAGSRLVIYRNRGHGFAHRPETQEEDDDAENAFSIARNWLHDFLVVNRENL